MEKFKEGTWHCPYSKNEAEAILALLKHPITAEDAPHLLYNLYGNDKLFDSFYDPVDPQDVRPEIIQGIKELVDNIESGESMFTDHDSEGNVWKVTWDPEVVDILKKVASYDLEKLEESYNYDIFEELVNYYEQTDLPLNTIWDEIAEQYGNENLANDVTSQLEQDSPWKYSSGFRAWEKAKMEGSRLKETKYISKGYTPKDPYELIFSKIDSFFGYYDRCVWRVEAPVSETPQNVAVRFKYGSDKEDFEKVANILKNMGAKYIKIKPTYQKIVCKLDLSVFEKEIEDIKNKNREAYEKAMSTINIDKFKPNQAIIDKLSAYRDKGSRVNVKAIKDPNKLLVYYYAGVIMGWKALCSDIKGTDLGEEYEGEMQAIDQKAKEDTTQVDTRDAFAKKKELPSSANGLFTFEKEGQGCWLPKKILMYFVDKQIPVYFGKVTGGAQYDRNGCQWSEIEHLTVYPNTPKARKIDIVVHTNEGNDSRYYTVPGYTDIRVSAQDVVNALKRKFGESKSSRKEFKLDEGLVNFKDWLPEDVDLYKSIDWKARHYEAYPVPGTEYEGRCYLYDMRGKKGVVEPFIRYINANPIYPPYYAPVDNIPGEDYTSAMYDGRHRDGYQIHDRRESWELYKLMGEKTLNESIGFYSYILDTYDYVNKYQRRPHVSEIVEIILRETDSYMSWDELYDKVVSVLNEEGLSYELDENKESKENEMEKSKMTESNPITDKLSDELNDFMMDMAQIYVPGLTYGKIMHHNYTDEEINTLETLMRKCDLSGGDEDYIYETVVPIIQKMFETSIKEASNSKKKSLAFGTVLAKNSEKIAACRTKEELLDLVTKLCEPHANDPEQEKYLADMQRTIKSSSFQRGQYFIYNIILKGEGDGVI